MMKESINCGLKASQDKFEGYLDSDIQKLSSVENPFGVGRVKIPAVSMFVTFSDFFSF